MKFKDILEKIGSFTNSPLGEILQAVVPGVSVVDSIVDSVNEHAPNKISKDSTVGEVTAAIESLPPDAKLSFLEKQTDLKIVESNNFAAVAIAQEASMKSSARPEVIKKLTDMFVQFGYLSFAFLSLAMILDAIIVSGGDKGFIFDIAMTGIPWLFSSYALPVMNLIMSYFKYRSGDKITMAAASGAKEVPPIPVGIFQQAKSLFSNK